MLEVRIPKWNQESFYPLPMITYDTNELVCSGFENTQSNISCFLQRGRDFDTIKLLRPLKKNADTTEDGDAEDSD